MQAACSAASGRRSTAPSCRIFLEQQHLMVRSAIELALARRMPVKHSNVVAAMHRKKTISIAGICETSFTKTFATSEKASVDKNIERTPGVSNFVDRRFQAAAAIWCRRHPQSSPQIGSLSESNVSFLTDMYASDRTSGGDNDRNHNDSA